MHFECIDAWFILQGTVPSRISMLSWRLRTAEAPIQNWQRVGQVEFMTAFQLCLPLANFFVGHFRNPETVRDAKVFSGNFTLALRASNEKRNVTEARVSDARRIEDHVVGTPSTAL